MAIWGEEDTEEDMEGISIGSKIHSTNLTKAGAKVDLLKCLSGKTNMTATFLLFSLTVAVVSVMDLEQ